MEQRPAPVVSISDPARPGTPGDVLSAGGERDPWRPRMGHVRAGLLVLALVAAAVVPVQLVAARAEDGRAATAAADAVLLDVPAGGDGLTVVLGNDGPQPLRLVDLQVEAPGYRRVRGGGALPSHGVRYVQLRDTRSCGDDLLVAGDTGTALVRVRTPAGRLVTRTVLLPTDRWAALVEAARTRCGYLTPEQALTTSVRVQQRGSRLSLHLAVRNRGRVPLVLQSVVDPVGSSFVDAAGAGLPVTVPAGGSREVTVTVVPGCGADGPGDPTSPLLALQVLPLLTRGQGQPTSVEVLDPGARRRVAALPVRCTAVVTGG